LPALAEAMPGFESTIWYGLLAPAGTPAAIVNKVHDETEKFLNMPETKKRLADVGVIVAPQTPAEFDSFIKSEIVRWGEACRAAGIEPQ
jgi:tripartite-type tricarboxylate transporter receptor subunit TctC